MFMLAKWSYMAFCIFIFSKQIQLFWKILHKFVIKIDSYDQKVKCFVFVSKKIAKLSNLTNFSRRCTQIAFVHWLSTYNREKIVQ